MSKVYLGHFNQYKVGTRIATGMKEAKFYQRGYMLMSGKEYKIEKLNNRVQVWHDIDEGFIVV